MLLENEDLTADKENQRGDQVTMVWSASFEGNAVVPIRIECALGRGFSGIVMIGGVGQVCEDGKERAKAALEYLGWSAPARKILLSVSPGDVKIDRTHLDLPLSVALAGATATSPWAVNPGEWLFAAEMGISGELRPVAGVVGCASAAMEMGLRGVIVAHKNLEELHCMGALGGRCANFQCLGFKTLHDVLRWLEVGDCEQSRPVVEPITKETSSIPAVNFDDMDLSEDLFTLAAVVAAGSHSLLMRGSPGTGKSMFAKRLCSIMPPMSDDQHLKALRIYSSAASVVPQDIIRGRPPFRAPHHYTSLAAMVGTTDRPGELAMASGGILFLDELPEFRRDVLEGLREPLETGEVAVSRAKGRQTWNADVILIAAANNCPCGWTASRRRRCECAPARVLAYRNRLSGPLQDRVDIHVNMPENPSQINSVLSAPLTRQDQTQKLITIVKQAREKAAARSKLTGVLLNKDIPAKMIFDAFGLPGNKAIPLVTKVIPSHASARSTVRCLRVARTVADIEGDDVVRAEHIERAWNWQALAAARFRGEVTPL